ncbi:hypothetical protein D3C72_1218250 [compost metagenome]
MHRAITVGHHRCTIEHQGILAAHHVEVGDGRAAFAGTCSQHRIALGMLAALVGRSVGHHHQLRTGTHRIGQRLGEPQVFADQQAHRNAINLEHAAATVRVDIEVAALVEHRVIGQLALAVGLLHQAITQHAGRVVDHGTGRLRPTDHSSDATARRGNAGHRLLALVQEARAQQQVLRRIAADRQLGEHHQPGAVLVARLADHLDDALGVAGDIANREVELRHRDADRSHEGPACGCNGHIVTPRHLRAGRSHSVDRPCSVDPRHAWMGFSGSPMSKRRKAARRRPFCLKQPSVGSALQNRLPEAVDLISPAWRWQRPGRPANAR